MWCELPNWNRFSPTAAAAGLQTLTEMVEALGNHPSIVAWTIINEDWGTDLRRAADQRRWLADAYEHLRRLDPTRLIVDNSACGGPGDENFHVRSDLADFHVYSLVPDHAATWRDRIADYATRPGWLWSPEGDAQEQGDEPLILSEFGSWGLPDPRAFIGPGGSEPWWFATGPLAGRPADMAARIEAFGLDRVFDGVAGLVRATQEHQLEALRYEIAELRRHASISGYVITELSDIYWEANGLLDLARRPKAFHDRLAAINAPTVVVGDLHPRDWRAGDRIRVPVTVSSWDGTDAARRPRRLGDRGRRGSAGPSGRIDFDGWPSWTARVVGELEAILPDVAAASRATVHLVLRDAEGHRRAVADVPFAIVPRALVGRRSRGDRGPGRRDDHRPPGPRRARSRPRRRAPARPRHRPRGHRCRTSSSRCRCGSTAGRPPTPPQPTAGAVWQGDWITTFAWAVTDELQGITAGRCLDLPFERVLPELVITGDGVELQPRLVTAGLFAGWVHAPAAFTVAMDIGAGPTGGDDPAARRGQRSDGARHARGPRPFGNQLSTCGDDPRGGAGALMPVIDDDRRPGRATRVHWSRRRGRGAGEEKPGMRSNTLLRAVAGAAALGLLLGACGPRGGTASEPAVTAPPAPTPAASAEAGASAEPTEKPALAGDLSVWTYPQGDDETSLKAYKAAFEELYPDVTVKISVVPEDTYQTKVTTALQAHKPPDVAIIEDRAWMKADRVLDLTPYYASWGVDVADFNPGGIGRATVEGDVADGVYGVGDFLGGNIFVYNKALFDAAGIPYPAADKSLTIQEYADICRKLAKPDPDPAKAVYGCSMPEWAPGIQTKDVFGADGRSAEGNLNSPEMVEAFNIAGAAGPREGGARRDRADRDRRVRPVCRGPARDHLDGLHRDPEVRRRGPPVRARAVPRDQAR